MDKPGPGSGQVAGRIIASQTEHMTARVAAADSGVLGVWWSKVHDVQQWDARVGDGQPFGRIELTFGDLAGWRPYVSVSGIHPQAPVQCDMRYRYDGTEVWDTVPLNYADGRHVGVGGISDGSLGGNSRWSGIRLACIAGFPGNAWGFEEVTFGYVQLAEPG